jgi:hypothetical protein
MKQQNTGYMKPTLSFDLTVITPEIGPSQLKISTYLLI